MAATNYMTPDEGPYGLVRIRGKKAEILDPAILDKILSILELHGEGDRTLWDALYRSQPFHSTQADPTGAHWRKGMFYGSPEYQVPHAFPWAVQQGRIPPRPA